MKGLRGRAEGESQLPRILRIKKLFLGIKLVCYRNEEIQDELSTCTSQTPQAECHRESRGRIEHKTLLRVDTATGPGPRQITLTPSSAKTASQSLHTSKEVLFCFLTSCGHMLTSSFPDLNHQMGRLLWHRFPIHILAPSCPRCDKLLECHWTWETEDSLEV